MAYSKTNTKYLYTALVHYAIFASSNVNNTIEYCGSRWNIYKVLINNSSTLCYTCRQKICTMKNLAYGEINIKH